MSCPKILNEHRSLSDQVKYSVIRIFPPALVLYMKSIYRMLHRIINAIYLFCECFGPYERTRIYKGFILACTRGYSLVSRIRGNNVYEPELSKRVIDELKRTKSEYFLDAGANIGLISLNILSQVPGVKIFCFEPGPRQSELLKRTINYNSLQEKVQLYQYALGEEKGELQFATHCFRHAGGDGFFDTKRSGKYSFINVAVDTLDNWWKFAGYPLVKVIKIDIEGAELWLLRGARLFIKQCRPVIFLEINETNLKPYPYCGKEVLRYFIEQQYSLRTLDGVLITEKNLYYNLKQNDSYVASPNESERMVN
jgi:FkbM family methyltransferase